MASFIRNVTFDCAAPHEPYDLAVFWAAVVGQPVHPDDSPGGDEVRLKPPSGLPTLLFVRVPEAKTLKNRVHLCLEPEQGRTRDEEVERVIGLGAVIVDDQRRSDGRGWVVLGDPAGNELCVLRSTAERAG